MIIGIFTDKEHRPTDAEIVEAVGSKWRLWEALIEHVRAGGRVQEELKFMYGPKYGWGLRFGIGGKLLTALYPASNGFTVQLILRPGAIEQAERSGCGRNVQEAITRARPYPEGRWLFIPVESQNDLRDVQYLLALKREAKARKKTLAKSAAN